MRVFVTGATGFVGENVARDLAARGHEVIAARRPDFVLEAPVIPAGVEAVVHCAALARVGDCERDPAAAERLNVDATRALALESAERAIPLVFTSTDLVFDGGAPPYDEEAPTSAPTVYGQTKVRAERAVLEADPRNVVLRLALVVGAHGGRPGGFLAWLVDGLARAEPLTLYENQRRAPLFVGDLAPVVEAALTGRLAGGVYHLASEPGVSREEIGHAVARAFRLPSGAIRGARLERGPGLPEVDDCTLRTTKIARAIGVSFTPLEAALARVCEEAR